MLDPIKKFVDFHRTEIILGLFLLAALPWALS